MSHASKVRRTINAELYKEIDLATSEDDIMDLRDTLDETYHEMKSIDKRLDDILAIFVKLRYTNDEGYGHCYTCETPLHYDYMDCGHYPKISRQNLQFRWDKDLARPQCINCNRIKCLM